jgi:hypothetical protein
MYATYGYVAKSQDDEWLRAVRAAGEHISEAAQPTGTWFPLGH